MGELFVYTMIVVVFLLPIWLEGEYLKRVIKKEGDTEVDENIFQITHEMIEAFNAGDMAREEELFQKAEGLRHYQYVVKKAKSAIKQNPSIPDREKIKQKSERLLLAISLNEITEKDKRALQDSIIADEDEWYDLLEEQRRANYYLKRYMWQKNLDPEGMYTVAEWNRFREMSARARKAEEHYTKEEDIYEMLHRNSYGLCVKDNRPLQTTKPAGPLSPRWKQ